MPPHLSDTCFYDKNQIDYDNLALHVGLVYTALGLKGEENSTTGKRIVKHYLRRPLSNVVTPTLKRSSS